MFEKQKNVEKIKEQDEPFNRGVWVGFTFKGKAPNDNNEEVGPRFYVSLVFVSR